MKSDFELSWANKGCTLYYLGSYEEALASCNKALEFEPNDYIACFNKSFILIKLRRYQEAIISINKGLKNQPENHIALYNKARSYALIGNSIRAIKNLKSAIKLNFEEIKNTAKIDPYFDTLRKNKKFQLLIE
ncbi:tetratricopeptide repeat protein [Nostoc sp.]|uniref:tetratricopeptide repeat protein n=1 Tax=Nostoc sp. TaxID=1180 RepID=UPI002FF45EE9